jgi:small GTP-binding protein
LKPPWQSWENETCWAYEGTIEMYAVTLDGTLAVLRESEIRLIGDIAETLGEMGDSAQDDRKRLQDVAYDLRDLFFLVAVIGEFNAGKSSFVNALLGDKLLPVGITPTTEQIELIRYGETPTYKPRLREDGIREWEHPNTGAPGVAIVDTPGTGSVFRKHEATAKAFLHRSDMVVFVISAKRAFAETERMYLELAKNYGKKIILVVNQIDLLEPKERDEVRRFIERQAAELLDLRPLLFMVSARDALDGMGEGNIDAVRAHFRGVFSEAPPAQQKLLVQLDMAQQVVRRYQDMIKGKADLVSADTAKVREVQQELEQQAVGLEGQLAGARAEIDRVFEGIRQRGLSFIDHNLSIRKLGRRPKREALQAEFQEVVIGRALRDINEATNGYINAVIDQSRLYWRSIIDRLNQLRELMEQELSGLDSGVYAEQRESLEEAIRIAEAELKSYSTGKVVEDIQGMFEANLNSFVNSAVAAMGGWIVTLLAISSLAPGGIAAGPLAIPALIIAAPVAALGSVAAYRYYRKTTTETRRDFNERVDRVERIYHEALQDLTQKERNRLTQYGKQVLTPIFSRLDVLAQRYENQQARLEDYQKQIETLRRGITEIA